MGALHTTADLVAPCGVDELWWHVESLDRYPAWMRLVHDVEPLADDAHGPAWSVELRARVGPLARSKRLRMVRTLHEPVGGDRRAVFERVELDGRRHSPWTLTVDVGPAGPGESRVAVHLDYAGSLWTGGVLQRILDDAIRDGRDELRRLVSGPTR